MSGGSFAGAIFLTIGASAIWVILGKFIEAITKAFNRSITVIPTFQDAVNGFNMMEIIWGAIIIIILIGIWFNYILNSNTRGNQVV